MNIIVNQFFKFLFLLTPFFVLSMFLSMTNDWAVLQKRKLALRIGLSAFVICLVLLFFGKFIFNAFGITLDAFRIGGGAVLFLSAVGLVNSNVTDKKQVVVEKESRLSDIAVVPLAIPVTVGPGTIGALLVIGAESQGMSSLLMTLCGLIGALAVLTMMLFAAAWIEEKIGRNTIVILSKLTGLVLAAMAAQMIFTGIRSFLILK